MMAMSVRFVVVVVSLLLLIINSSDGDKLPMPKCVPMTRSSELRPLTLLLYVVPVTLMELLRR